MSGITWRIASAAAWGAGVALGVALGSWLTAAGQAGAGVGGGLSLTDLAVLPALAFAVTFVAAFAVLSLTAAIRRQVPASDGADGDA